MKDALIKRLESYCSHPSYFHLIPAALKELSRFSLTDEEKKKVLSLVDKASYEAKFAPLLPVENNRPELKLYFKKLLE